MIVILLFSLVEMFTSQPQACFLKCKDNYMHGMQTEMSESSTEWSVDMVTPLQALLETRTKRGGLARRLDRVCRLNSVFNRCLNVCSENPAKQILKSGQKAWNIICDHYHNDTEFRAIVVPCWEDNGIEISSKCSTLAHFLQAEIVSMMESGLDNINEGFSNLCRSTHAYDKCFVYENYETCGINAGKFLITLTHQTSHALIELLDEVLGVSELPRPCKDWLNQKDMTGSQRTRALQRRNSSPKISFFSRIIDNLGVLILFKYLS